MTVTSPAPEAARDDCCLAATQLRSAVAPCRQHSDEARLGPDPGAGAVTPRRRARNRSLALRLESRCDEPVRDRKPEKVLRVARSPRSESLATEARCTPLQ